MGFDRHRRSLAFRRIHKEAAHRTPAPCCHLTVTTPDLRTRAGRSAGRAGAIVRLARIAHARPGAVAWPRGLAAQLAQRDGEARTAWHELARGRQQVGRARGDGVGPKVPAVAVDRRQKATSGLSAHPGVSGEWSWRVGSGGRASAFGVTGGSPRLATQQEQRARRQHEVAAPRPARERHHGPSEQGERSEHRPGSGQGRRPARVMERSSARAADSESESESDSESDSKNDSAGARATARAKARARPELGVRA